MRTAAAMLLLAALTVAAPADSLARAEKDLAGLRNKRFHQGRRTLRQPRRQNQSIGRKI